MERLDTAPEQDTDGQLTDLAVNVTDLSKSFGDTAVLKNLTLKIPAGSVYGILGPNGAGKTTTVKILATLLTPDSGTARVVGHDVTKSPARVRSAISLTGQYASVDDELTGRENLTLIAQLLGFPKSDAANRAKEVLGNFDLLDAADKQVGSYSGGMRRRLDIGASLLRTPELLFLDEPTTGLDPRSRNQVWELVRNVAAEGTTVVLTTQYLEEADQLAEGIAVIDDGHVIDEGTPGQLKAAIGAGTIRVRAGSRDQSQSLERILSTHFEQVTPDTTDPRTLIARTENADPERVCALAATALTDLHDAGIYPEEFALGQPSLDEVFLSLTNKETAE